MTRIAHFVWYTCIKDSVAPIDGVTPLHASMLWRVYRGTAFTLAKQAQLFHKEYKTWDMWYTSKLTNGDTSPSSSSSSSTSVTPSIVLKRMWATELVRTLLPYFHYSLLATLPAPELGITTTEMYDAFHFQSRNSEALRIYPLYASLHAPLPPLFGDLYTRDSVSPLRVTPKDVKVTEGKEEAVSSMDDNKMESLG